MRATKSKSPKAAAKPEQSSLRERFLQCFVARATNTTLLRGIVYELTKQGVCRSTLIEWAVVEHGYSKSYVASLLSGILVSMGLRQRKAGAGRKPSEAALQLLGYARKRYGINHLHVLRAAWRAGKAQPAAADGKSESGGEHSDVIVAPQLAHSRPQPKKLPGGKLPHGYWQFPNGCDRHKPVESQKLCSRGKVDL